jgi:hypothetical protein
MHALMQRYIILEAYSRAMSEFIFYFYKNYCKNFNIKIIFFNINNNFFLKFINFLLIILIIIKIIIFITQIILFLYEYLEL